MKTDPVCGMEVAAEKSAGKSTYEGNDYFFCSTNCKGKFDANPESFTSPRSSPLPTKSADIPKGEGKENAAKKTKTKNPAAKTSVVTLPVEGMTCASCVNTIEGALNKAEGVAKAVVNFATEKATIEFDPQTLTESDLVKIIEGTGYRVAGAREKVTFKLGGMTCASCAQTIEKALNKADGVFEAAVNLATEQAVIEFDAGVTGPANLEQVIEGTGYHVVKKEGELKEKEKGDEDLIKVKKAKRLLML